MTHKVDDESADELGHRILELDENIVGCYIIRVPDAVVIADLVGEEYKSTVKPFANAGAGMAAKWGLVGLSASRRMDSDRGRTLYLTAARETFVSLLFLHPRNENLEIGVMLTPDVEPRKIYDIAMKEI